MPTVDDAPDEAGAAAVPDPEVPPAVVPDPEVPPALLPEAEFEDAELPEAEFEDAEPEDAGFSVSGMFSTPLSISSSSEEYANFSLNTSAL